MVFVDYDETPETYGSYKKRFFNKYKEKARLLFRGVDDLSLKPKDKLLLKKEFLRILKI